MNAHSDRPPVALRGIALFEIAKGLLALAAAYGIISLRKTDLQAAIETFLLSYGINPETHFKRMFVESLAKATKLPVGQIVGFAIVYSLVRFAEGIGLWQGKHWAEWFAVISVGLYLPLELIHLVRSPTWFSSLVVIVNAALLLYLIYLLVQQRRMRAEKASSKTELLQER